MKMLLPKHQFSAISTTTKHQLTILLCIFIFQTSTSKYRIEAAQQDGDLNSIKQQNKNISDQDASAAMNNDSQDAFQVPFIVLMSKDSISVAQLPLIENGTVSTVYSLDGFLEVPQHDDDDNNNNEEAVAGEEVENEDDHRNQIANDDQKDDEDEDHGKSSSSSSSSTFNADAREYEQMPAGTNSFTSTAMKSLGKSEWQQIAIGARGSEEEIGTSSPSSQQPQQTTQATSSTTSRKEEDVQEGQAEEAIRPRKRRSTRRRRRSSGNSLILADDGGAQTNSGNNNEAAKSQQRQQHYNSNTRDAQANEASSSSTVALQGEEATAAESSRNVTSAQLRTESGQAQHKPGELPASRLAKKEVTAAITLSLSSEGSDKNSQIQTAESSSSSRIASRVFAATNLNSNVQFCDFDVHMSLGFVFVADSTGRIHRFKLSSGSKSMSAEQFSSGSDASKYQGSGRGASSIMRDDLTGNDLANTIDAGGKFEFTPKLRPATRIGGGKISHSTSETNLASNSNSNINFDDDAPASAAAADDHHREGTMLLVGGASLEANRVNIQGEEDVLHEQSSSDNGSGERQHPTIYGAQNGTKNSSSGTTTTTWSSTSDAPISGESQQTTTTIHSNLGGEQLLVPKVIWWRNKYTPPHAQGSEKTTPTGALLSAQRGSQAYASHQVANGRPRSNFGSSQSSRVEHGTPKNNSTTSESVDSGESHMISNGRIGQLKKRGERYLPTEVAVDWLNNLLFVLDKYRLFVVDFEGNNELLLIDDFNPNNRPVNLKLDPVNGFLFWLQIGKFHNTIYRLDLSMQSATQKLLSNTVKLRQTRRTTAANSSENVSAELSNDSVALSSHHYAHAKITNLPRHVRRFTIDHKHSRIYVPLNPAPSNTRVASGDQSGKPNTNSKSGYDFERTNESSQREDAEIFAISESGTHLNTSASNDDVLMAPTDIEVTSDKNCTTTNARELNAENENGQILAYNLDGTDVGPLRTADSRSHIASLDDIQDLTVDSEKALLYWLKDGGRELFEEYKEGTSINAAQHNLDGTSYSKLIHFNDNGFNQPTHQKPRFNMRKIIHLLANSMASNRLTRDSYERGGEASSLNGRHRLIIDSDGSDSSRFSRNAPFIILGITCLIVIAVYLIYAFTFQAQANNSAASSASTENHCRIESIGPGSTYSDDSHVVGADINSGFLNSSTISRWVGGGRPSTRGGGTDVSTLNRGTNCGSTRSHRTTNHSETCDFDTTNYGASNAIDEHYRGESVIDSGGNMFGLDTTAQLANLSHWPSNTHDLSNKLYVPVEVLQDEALSAIHRVSIDQLEIERKSPLGEGHFGMVLQGTIKCQMNEKGQMLHSNGQSTLVPSSPVSLIPTPMNAVNQRARLPINSIGGSSSGHGSSSSTSCEFATANSCADATTTTTTNQGDYLTPRSQGTSSDYNGEIQTLSEAESYSSYGGGHVASAAAEKLTMFDARLKVAIKKLKANASAEEKRDFLQEAKLLANFDHPNIVHLIGICLDRGSTYIVMELMLGGDLIRYMQENIPHQMNVATTSGGQHQHSNNNLDYDDLLKICLDIVNGCCYLEDLDYIHRDLAARNCLVSSQKREERIVKLADFGLARDIYKDSYYKKLNDSAMPLKWMAPECLIEQKFTKKSDVWSFGVVLWEVMSYCQEKPYGSVEPFFMKEHLASGARLRKPADCDENMYKLMNQCWQMEPENRPTFHECRAILIEIRNNSK